LALRIGCSERALRGWLSGEHKPRPYYLGQLSLVLDMDVDRVLASKEEELQRISRKDFLQRIRSIPIAVAMGANTLAISRHTETLAALAAINVQYRALQRHGIAKLDEPIKAHISSIQGSLESFKSDAERHEAWRILAQAQLLLRLNVTREKDL